MLDSDGLRHKEASAIFDNVELAYDREEHDSCLKLLARLRDEFEDLVDTWNIDMWQGLCNFQKSDFLTAKSFLENALTEVRTLKGEELYLFSILNAIGISNYELENYLEAISQLGEALSVVSNHKDIVYEYTSDVTIFWMNVHIGQSLFMLHRFNEALKYMLEAKLILANSSQFTEQDDPKQRFAIVEFEIGRLHYSVGNFDKARKQLESVPVDDLPEQPRSLYFSCLGSNYYYEKNYDLALLVFNKMLESGVPEALEDRIFFEMGYCYFRTSDLKNAQKFFKKCLESEADSPEFHDYAKQGLVEVQKASNK